MPITRVVCTSCQAALKSSAGFKPGQKVRCPKCHSTIVVRQPVAEVIEDEEDEVAPPPARAKFTGVKRKPAAVIDDDEDEEEERPVRKKKKKKKGGYKNSPLRFVVLGGLVVVLVVLGYFLLLKTRKDQETIEQNKRTLEKNSLIEQDNEEGVSPTRLGPAVTPRSEPSSVNTNKAATPTPAAPFVGASVTADQRDPLVEFGKKMVGKWASPLNNPKQGFEITFRLDGTHTVEKPPFSEANLNSHEGKWVLTRLTPDGIGNLTMASLAEGNIHARVSFRNDDTLVIHDFKLDIPMSRVRK